MMEIDVKMCVAFFFVVLSFSFRWSWKAGFISGKADGWRQGWNDAMDINHRPVKKRKRWTLGPEGES